MFAFFHNSYNGIGGIENLIFNIARYVDQHEKEKIKIFGPVKSYLYQRLTEEKVNCDFIDLNEPNPDRFFNEKDTIILFSYIDAYRNFEHCKAKIIVWNVLNYSIINWNRMNIEQRLTGRKIISHYLTKKLIYSCYKLESFVCMDGDTKTGLNSFIRKNLDFPLVPIPIPIEYETSKYNEIARPENIAKIRISYIGRGHEAWKIYPLERVIKDFREAGINYELHIFTDVIHNYEKILNPVKSDNAINYYLNIFGNSLKNKLLEISDLHFGMGTSALEGAVLGIPTILLDPSTAPIRNNYKYQWLFEREGYSLGKFIDDNSKLCGHSITEIYNSMLPNKSRTDLSQRCFQYIQKNHSLAHVLKLLRALNPQAQLKDVFRYTPNSWKISNLLSLPFFRSLK